MGVDGEGLGGDPSRYVLLGVGEHQIENPDGLNFEEIATFLYSRFKAEPRGTAFVGFFLGYDFTQWFKSLPGDRAWMLLHKEGIRKRAHRVKGKEPHPVSWRGWQFDILGSKRLRLRPHTCGCKLSTCGHKHESWMYICDVGGYWQTSFLNVIHPSGWTEPVVTPEEYKEIERGKGKRDSAVLDEDMRRYNRLENVALSRAMTALESGFQRMGVHLSPRQWFGPGQAAGAWLKEHSPKKEELAECVPDWFMEAGRKSYFGGWFEVMMHGHIPGTTHEYDINSAYPTIIAKLPCLLHGKYFRGTGAEWDQRSVRSTDICFVHATVTTPNLSKNPNAIRCYTGPMSHRTSDGSVSRPTATRGWFNFHELAASCKAKLAAPIRKTDIDEWVIYRPCDCPPPFGGIRELYQLRLEAGKSSPLGKGAKLAYNSAYGKFAQSEGNPPFGNAVYAALITCGCREMILNAIATHPQGAKALAMVATDAVFFTEPHPGLEVNKELGGWDHTPREALTIFKPGVYWDETTRQQIAAAARGDAESKPKFKARGINAATFMHEIWKIDFEFSHLTELSGTDGSAEYWPNIVYECDFSMVTALQALMRNDWSLAGRVNSVEQKQDSRPSTKRGKRFWDAEMGVYRTECRQPTYNLDRRDWDADSVPYRKMFGLDDPFSDESRESAGLTQDGLIGEMFKRLLKNDEW